MKYDKEKAIPKMSGSGEKVSYKRIIVYMITMIITLICGDNNVNKILNN